MTIHASSFPGTCNVPLRTAGKVFRTAGILAAVLGLADASPGQTAIATAPPAPVQQSLPQLLQPLPTPLVPRPTGTPFVGTSEIAEEIASLRNRSGKSVSGILQSILPQQEMDQEFRNELQRLNHEAVHATTASPERGGSPQTSPQSVASLYGVRSGTSTAAVATQSLSDSGSNQQIQQPHSPPVIVCPYPNAVPPDHAVVAGHLSDQMTVTAPAATFHPNRSPPLPFGWTAPNPSEPRGEYRLPAGEPRPDGSLVFLRQISRRLDEAAADLEEIGLFAHADRIRAEAQAIRMKARPTGN